MSRRLTFPLGPVFLLAALAAVAMITRPLTPIDETRYVSVAWEMCQFWQCSHRKLHPTEPRE